MMLCLATVATGLVGLHGGCVLPAPLVLEEDAGTGGRPQIVRDRLKDPPYPEFDHRPDSDDDGLEFEIYLRDPDSELLTIRMFLDSNYTTRLPISKETLARDPSEFGQTQVLITNLRGLCGQLITDLQVWHPLEVWVSDAGFIPDPAEIDAGGSSSPFIDLRQPGPGGTRDGVTWQVRCQPAVSTADAGGSR
jgi:hypothetical protein